MHFYLHPQKLLAQKSYVPSTSPSSLKFHFRIYSLIFLLVTTINGIDLTPAREWRRFDLREIIQPGTSFASALGNPQLENNELPLRQAPVGYHLSMNEPSPSLDEPTPPLTRSFSRSASNNHDQEIGSYNPEAREDTTNSRQHHRNHHHHNHHHEQISPHRVSRKQRSPVQIGPEINLMTPLFENPVVRPTQLPPNQDLAQFSSQADVNNLDIIEQGSGAGWPDSPPFDRPEEVTTLNDPGATPTATQNSPLMTPTFDQMPIHPGGDSPPLLMRRLPKLIATSGLAWQYVIPSDTFQDEDGDLRQLKSSLNLKQPLPDEQNTIHGPSRVPFSKYTHWLQYDQNTQTLYGFPTDRDAGRHEYILQVSDRWNLVNNETVEITVRPHQSSQAFTHSITIGGIEWPAQRRSSMSEVLIDLVKLISESVFNDANGLNMVVHSYKLTDMTQDPQYPQSRSTLSISWSNSSIPIHPCDLSGIETVFRLLIDERYITPTWSLQTHGNSDLAPSQALLKALNPDFKPSSVSISLQGACESRKPSFDNSVGGMNPLATEPRVKNRIGKMRWKLGQPIIYQIPNGVFTVENGTASLSMTLHTIDGKTLEQDVSYNFLEFDQEKQTIFGLPFDFTRHVGQKELLLTARNPSTNQRARETFVIDIEPQDLTTINNRAFRMSLYFLTRSNVFGPREEVQVSRRMISALELGDLNYDHDQERPEFTVMNIQQFATSSIIENSATLNDPANAWKYQDKIHLVNDANSFASENLKYDQFNGDGTIFYKFTWTNETIGSRGECPVEVIKENILYALERSMIYYTPPHEAERPDDSAKNDSVRFYERLRSYFEPELDLIHLRFEPLGACLDALELHDVGNSEVADLADKAGDSEPDIDPTPSTAHVKPQEVISKSRDAPPPINSDEYWAIIELIILVFVIILIVILLFMGLHLYRVNQEKRFELQIKLAQARQNSMYLSSMMLADPSYSGDVMAQQAGLAKPVYVDERSSRKPAILDVEKQILANGNANVPMYKPTTVHLTGQSVQTTPLNGMQNTGNMIKVVPDTMIANQQMFADGRHQSMTLNRRMAGGTQNRALGRQVSMSQLSHSQSIITVASTGPQGPFVTQAQAGMPFVYAPMPVFYESANEMPHEL